MTEKTKKYLKWGAYGVGGIILYKVVFAGHATAEKTPAVKSVTKPMTPQIDASAVQIPMPGYQDGGYAPSYPPAQGYPPPPTQPYYPSYQYPTSPPAYNPGFSTFPGQYPIQYPQQGPSMQAICNSVMGMTPAQAKRQLSTYGILAFILTNNGRPTGQSTVGIVGRTAGLYVVRNRVVSVQCGAQSAPVQYPVSTGVNYSQQPSVGTAPSYSTSGSVSEIPAGY